jgi:hypothetical protein
METREKIMTITAISSSTCTAREPRPALDLLVEKLARRLLRWSERPRTQRHPADERLVARLADERALKTVHLQRWY